MKKFFYIVFILGIFVSGQNAEDYFVESADAYIQDQKESALKTVNAGIEKYPKNAKLLLLKKKIEEENKQNNSDQNKDDSNQDKDNGSKENKDEKGNEDQQDQKEGEDKGDKGSGESDKKPQQEEGNQNENSRPSEADLRETRHNQLLEALEKQEQNTQKKLMMGKSRKRLFKNEKDW